MAAITALDAPYTVFDILATPTLREPAGKFERIVQTIFVGMLTALAFIPAPEKFKPGKVKLLYGVLPAARSRYAGYPGMAALPAGAAVVPKGCNRGVVGETPYLTPVLRSTP
jgi:hypothetical protein